MTRAFRFLPPLFIKAILRTELAEEIFGCLDGNHFRSLSNPNRREGHKIRWLISEFKSSAMTNGPFVSSSEIPRCWESFS
jgi:hypothetical protein